MADSVDKHGKSAHEPESLGCSLVELLIHLYTRSVSFRHKGILMPSRELLGCAFTAVRYSPLVLCW